MLFATTNTLTQGKYDRECCTMQKLITEYTCTIAYIKNSKTLDHKLISKPSGLTLF